MKFSERDLHILLSSFVNADEHFKCSTKTIYHENSKREKSGKNKWLHPDIVGIHFPFESYTENTLKLFDILKVNPYKLYSFEMKIDINLKLHCYFVVELKTVEFEPEFAGKLSFYLSAIDGELKSKTDNPSIGLLLCKGVVFLQSTTLKKGLIE